MPRSSNLISTVSEDGVTNVAPYALCTCVSVNPPIISLTVSKKPDGLKDTGKNIEATKEFGVSIVSDWFIESSMAAGGEFPSNVSEFEKTGLTPKPSSVIKAPLVAQSAVSLECKLISCTPFTNKEGVETCVCYQGEVVKVHANDEIYDNTTGNFNYEKFGLVAKLGGLQYAKINSLTEITLN
ncbi:hypothetical protein BCR32DRAFT_200990 [Anaeromyces robustus]|uniref:Flavin reductase like domain-containing protein n=1 Tax=Anaeromyces robustus TaxID=1754192 RepID=A0A1Y1XEU5_9FUNG|nr:hypothetical protein BCR32DRAFT_214332 [Anaeromyces robustus]ORX84290.1 hypothetical protein BCR32DRAFT_200990 [Anaeromyces robustus]|eukprot:ORX42167.1 hypothetical protein BCR32DRAFT_214332 [Anaeromyces robustus]